MGENTDSTPAAKIQVGIERNKFPVVVSNKYRTVRRGSSFSYFNIEPFLRKRWRADSIKMHIKSIIIDGFKSYAQRTEINGFDPLFNAITGLNGSGKSNILDSICFLLGISNLSHVSVMTDCKPI